MAIVVYNPNATLSAVRLALFLDAKVWTGSAFANASATSLTNWRAGMIAGTALSLSTAESMRRFTATLPSMSSSVMGAPAIRLEGRWYYDSEGDGSAILPDDPSDDFTCWYDGTNIVGQSGDNYPDVSALHTGLIRQTGTAQAGATNTGGSGTSGTLPLEHGASSAGLAGSLLVITGGTGIGQCHQIVSVGGVVDDVVVTINDAWDTLPDATSTYTVVSACDINQLSVVIAQIVADLAAGVRLTSSGLDSVLVESGISASSSLVNESASQLTSINARQALALVLAALEGKLSGALTTAVTIKAAGKSTTRVAATVDASGNRSALTLTVPD